MAVTRLCCSIFLLLTVCYLWSYCCQTSTLPGQVHAIHIILGLIWILIPLNMSDTGSQWVTVLKRGDDKHTLAECVCDCVCSKRADYGRDVIKETGHSKRELLRFLLCFLSPSKYIFQRLRPGLLISYREYTSICLLFFLSVKHNFSCTVSRPYCEKKVRTLGGVKWSMTLSLFLAAGFHDNSGKTVRWVTAPSDFILVWNEPDGRGYHFNPVSELNEQ